MKEFTTSAAVVPTAIVEDAWQAVGASFERFCTTAGTATLTGMPVADATRIGGPPYGTAGGKVGHPLGQHTGKVRFRGGEVDT